MAAVGGQYEGVGGRGKLSALGKDGEWLAGRQSGKDFRKQTAHLTRARRRDALEALCEVARDDALAAATHVDDELEDDAILVKMQEAIACDTRAGGAYTMLWEILNCEQGTGERGGRRREARGAARRRRQGAAVHRRHDAVPLRH